jgi:hypothetical protein
MEQGSSGVLQEKQLNFKKEAAYPGLEAAVL